jgi:hypothetical protein
MSIIDTTVHHFTGGSNIQVGKATRTVGDTTQQFLWKTTWKETTAPIFVQTPLCQLKQGFSKTMLGGGSSSGGKKTTTELLFSVTDSEFFDWMEQFEAFAVDYLFQNQKQWFQTELSKEEVENLFVSPFRISKATKTYSMRPYISPLLRLFDENKQPVDLNDKYETKSPIVAVLEIIGIRCSAKNFQLEVEMKQLMEMKEVASHELMECVIQPRIKVIPNITTTEEEEEKEMVEIKIEDVGGGKSDDPLIKIKSSAEVYQEIYQKALQKSLMARDLGIMNYLEEKQIGGVQMFLDLTS